MQNEEGDEIKVGNNGEWLRISILMVKNVENGQFLVGFEDEKVISGKIYLFLAENFCSVRKSYFCLQNTKTTAIVNWEYIVSS